MAAAKSELLLLSVYVSDLQSAEASQLMRDDVAVAVLQGSLPASSAPNLCAVRSGR